MTMLQGLGQGGGAIFVLLLILALYPSAGNAVLISAAVDEDAAATESAGAGEEAESDSDTVQTNFSSVTLPKPKVGSESEHAVGQKEGQKFTEMNFYKPSFGSHNRAAQDDDTTTASSDSSGSAFGNYSGSSQTSVSQDLAISRKDFKMGQVHSE